MPRRPDVDDAEDTAPPSSARSRRSSDESHATSNALRRREQRKQAKFATAGGTVGTTATPDSPTPNTRNDDARGDAREGVDDAENPMPGAYHVGNDIDLTDEHGTRFDDLSTLSPHTHPQGIPIAAELVLDRIQNGGSNGSPDVQEIVREVLRQQQRQGRPDAEEEDARQSVSLTPPPKPPAVAEAVVIRQKTICGFARSKFILGVLVILLLAGLGVALGVIFGGGNGDDGGPPTASGFADNPAEAPVSPPSLRPVQAPTDPPVQPPQEEPVDPPTTAPIPAPNEAPTPPPTPAPVTITDKLDLQLELIGEHNGDRFGAYTEFSGDGKTFAVAGSGSKPYVQIRRLLSDGSTWTQIGRLESGLGDTFGHRFDLDFAGNTIVIGSPRRDVNGEDSGTVEVFSYQSDGVWSQKGNDIHGFDTNDYFGWDVAISDNGNTIVATARTGDVGGLESGYVRVFVYDTNKQDWVQQGPALLGESQGDEFGRSCGISGDGTRIVVGAVLGAGGKGRVYVYEYDGSWSLLGQKLDGTNAEDWQGTSCDISGDGKYVAVGSDGYDGVGTNSGVVKIYHMPGCCEWVQYGNFVFGQTSSEQLGAGQVSLSYDGQSLAAGGVKHSGNQGIAYLYRFVSGDWRLVDSYRGEFDGDRYGFSVSVSGTATHMVAGAPRPGDRPGYAQIFTVG